jgi:hypothetical protein
MFSPRTNKNEMNDPHDLPADLKTFEAELASLAPDEADLDHARLLFAAGSASSAAPAPNRAARAWAAAFGAMTVVAASLLVVVVVRPDPPVTIVERVVHVPANASRIAADDRDPMHKAHTPTLRYPMPEKPNLLAAALFGGDQELAQPIRSSESYLTARHGHLLGNTGSPPRSCERSTETRPDSPEIKSRYELLYELIKNNS